MRSKTAVTVTTLPPSASKRISCSSAPTCTSRTLSWTSSYTLLLYNVGYARTVAFKRAIDLMRTGGILAVVHISEELEQAAWAVFERFNQDKEWSFTDCTTKVVMDHLGIRQVFVFDHHFDQMGFLRHP